MRTPVQEAWRSERRGQASVNGTDRRWKARNNGSARPPILGGRLGRRLRPAGPLLAAVLARRPPEEARAGGVLPTRTKHLLAGVRVGVPAETRRKAPLCTLPGGQGTGPSQSFSGGALWERGGRAGRECPSCFFLDSVRVSAEASVLVTAAPPTQAAVLFLPQSP